MKYMTRDQVLLALGPVNKIAPQVVKYEPDARFPILQFEQTKATQWVAELGWKPNPKFEKYMTLAVIELKPSEYDALPDAEFEGATR